ncbi:hydroxyacyl-thioester dehydratase type 2, mitochondrial isoform X3 [Diabrotica virgifera virgifera]|uniref:Hydroxyacyl-thioester dehydratase type 2, mitochondrial isoform X2 n=1 Tax=Diabrotica virgifera virgifera TaxID=50390 RepID=A0A6P7GIU4_DIAVI|nr:hydroxyacyl-thioester dehydratase type 2, mitochondrial isoform X2 [Diabrotica virgifera virgifera]XP_028145129.1 hydroxyacyl-thioester dehydratase type 2, mitochondrial isoform X3 [Diabrotica virgifera virgifera]
MATLITRRLSNTISKLKSFKIGDEVTICRNITKEDIDNFTLLSGDTNPIHSTDGQGLGVVHGAFLNCIVSSVMGTRLPGPGTIVVHQDLNFPNKCYIGETVHVSVKLVEDRKIMKVDFKCDVVERQKTVLYGSAKLLMSKPIK